MGRYGSLLSVTDAGWLDYIVQGSSANNCRHLYLISIFTKFREQSQTTVVLFVVNSWTDRPMYCSSPLQRLLFLGAFQLILQARDSHVGSFRHRWGHTFALDKLFSEILHNPELRLPCPSLYGTLFQDYILLKQAQPAYDGTCGTRPLQHWRRWEPSAFGPVRLLRLTVIFSLGSTLNKGRQQMYMRVQRIRDFRDNSAI